MFKEIFLNERDDMMEIDLMKEIKKKYKLKKLPAYVDDEFKPEYTYTTNTKNGKTKVFVNTKDYSSPVFNYEFI